MKPTIRRIAKFVLALILVLPTSGKTVAQDDGLEVHVLVEDMQCLINHIDEYSSRAGDTILVDLNKCPPEVNDDSSQAFQNERPKIKLDLGKSVDKLIVLRREELECLRAVSLNLTKRLLVFSPASCEIKYE